MQQLYALFFSQLYKLSLHRSAIHAIQSSSAVDNGWVHNSSLSALRPTLMWYVWTIVLTASSSLPPVLLSLSKKIEFKIRDVQFQIDVAVIISFIISLGFVLITCLSIFYFFKIVNEKKYLAKTKHWQHSPTNYSIKRMLTWTPFLFTGSASYIYIFLILLDGEDERILKFAHCMNLQLLAISIFIVLFILLLVHLFASFYYMRTPWLDQFLIDKKVPLPTRMMIARYCSIKSWHHILTLRNADDFPKQLFRTAFRTVFFSDKSLFQTNPNIVPVRFIFFYLSPISVSYIIVVVSSAQFALFGLLHENPLPTILPFLLSIMLWGAGAVSSYVHFIENITKDIIRNQRSARFQFPFLSLISQKQWDNTVSSLLEKSRTIATIVILTILPFTWTLIDAFFK